MNKEKLYQALEDLYNEYDAYYITNKYGSAQDNTHKEQFELLSKLQGEKVALALKWIRNCYDCYYKDDYLKDADAFLYLKEVIAQHES